MTAYWGRRDTWTIIAGVRDRHRRNTEGHCSACRSGGCGYQDRTASYLNFVDPALLRHQVLREPPAGRMARPPS